MLYPTSVKLKVRKQMLTTSEGAPKAYLGRASTYLDLDCTFFTRSSSERAELNEIIRDWGTFDYFLGIIGLDNFTVKRVSTSQDQMRDWLPSDDIGASSSVSFELQPKQNSDIDCTGHVLDIWPASGSLSHSVTVDNSQIDIVDSYKQYDYDSGRRSHVNSMLGKLAEFTGKMVVPVEDFTQFLWWYRCQMLAGSNQFTADWLTNEQLGNWDKASWVEPWGASFDGVEWNISIKLMLSPVVEVVELAERIVEYEEMAIEYNALRVAICNTITNLTFGDCP